MADDDTMNIDELLDLELSDDTESVTADALDEGPVAPLSIDDFLATYDEFDDAMDAADTDDMGNTDDTVNTDDVVADQGSDDDAPPVDGSDVDGSDEDALDGADLLELAEQTAARSRADAAAQATATAAAGDRDETAGTMADAADRSRPAESSDTFASSAMGSETATGLLLQYPSRDFPPPPVVRVEVPTGWLGTAMPDCEMAARGPDEIDGIYPTVVMRIRRIAAAVARDGGLEAFMGLSEGDGAEVLDDKLRADPEAPARRLLVRRTAPDGVVARTRHLFVYVPATEHVASVVSLAATWPESADAELGPTLTDVITSVRIFMPQRGR